MVALSSECGMDEFKRKVVVLELLQVTQRKNGDVEIVSVQEDDAVVLLSKYKSCLHCMFIYSFITTGDRNVTGG